jgi:DNA helicase IV
VKQLPSIGVLVMDEADVEPMAEALRTRLADSNVAVEACTDGKVVGTGEQVRVFDVKHIKGLEFEAVFFAGVDRLAHAEPELFDKYLYVGATRAATYLGLACFDKWPRALEPLRAQFTTSWH